jgi:exopolyphosphatase/guanosine-5'-triphosphate,3'-diphosphate pyrophosphatase
MALAARYHRQSPPKKSHEDYSALSPEHRHVVRVLGALLRLAEGLDRSHAQVVESLTAAADGDGLRVQLRAAGDPELELWAAARHAAPLAKALGCPVTFEAARRPGRRAARLQNAPVRAL